VPLCYKPEGRCFDFRCSHWIFNWPKPSSRTMALGSTQLLTEVSTRNLPGSKGRPARYADNLTVVCESTVYKMWEPRRLTNLWASTAFCRDSFVFSNRKNLTNITRIVNRLKECGILKGSPSIFWISAWNLVRLYLLRGAEDCIFMPGVRVCLCMCVRACSKGNPAARSRRRRRRNREHFYSNFL
jgi:hypothetical protein